MTKLKTSLFTLSVILLFSCSTTKFKMQGTLETKNFFKEIPFQLISNLMIVTVEIDSKNYNLVFDTGAEVHFLDQSLASQINFKSIKKVKVNSTTSSKRGQQIVSIPKVSLDGIEFNNTAAVFLDLSGLTKALGCFPIHGVLGNNLIRKSNWQIDYQNQVIRATDDFSKLKTSKDAHRLKMNAGKYGNIYFDIKISGVNTKATFDTGFTGKFQVGDMELMKGLKFQTVEGVLGADALGITTGEESYAMVEDFQVEDIPLKNQKVSFEKGASSLIGYKFWKHFTLTIDWKNDVLILDPISTIDSDELSFFEIMPSPNYEKGIIKIQRRIKGSKNHTDIPLGTKVLKINEHDVSNLGKTRLCDFWKTEWAEIKKQNSIQLLILKDNVEREITVNKIPAS
ncbi:MAG: retropepsin-like aspartic protease [Saprospiraceae bacterium]